MSTDPVTVEETTDQMAWGDNFIEINGVWYSKRDRNYTRTIPTRFIIRMKTMGNIFASAPAGLTRSWTRIPGQSPRSEARVVPARRA